MNQDVMEHKVTKKAPTVVRSGSSPGGMSQTKRKSQGFKMTSRLTKRAVAQILMLVQDKLHRVITNVTEYDPELVREALDHT